jgi:hypothetical protein
MMSEYQGTVILFMGNRPLPSCVISLIFCVHFVFIPAAAGQLAAEQLARSVVHCHIASGDTARPSQYKSSHLQHPSHPARQGRTPCWVASLRTSASAVVSTYTAQKSQEEKKTTAKSSINNLTYSTCTHHTTVQYVQFLYM